MKVFIVGAGVMASGIAQVFATGGHSVLMTDISPEALTKAQNGFNKGLGKLVEKGKMTEEKKNEILSNIKMTSNMEDAKDTDLVIGAASENMNVKKSIFGQLDGICTEKAIFAINTSSF